MNPITTTARTLEIQAWNLYWTLANRPLTRHALLASKAYARYERRTRLTDQIRRLEKMAA